MVESPADTPIRVQVPHEAQGVRLDQFLARFEVSVDDEPPEVASDATAQLGGLSRSRIQRLIDSGWVQVEGRPGRSSLRLQAEQVVTVRLPPAQPPEVKAEALPLDILYEDADVVAVNKAPGMVVHPGPGHAHGTLVNALLAHCQDLSGVGGVLRPGIVHRLDRGTSGVVVVAKNDAAHEGLALQFARREVRKLYYAYVRGAPQPPEGRIETPFGRHPRDRKRFSGRVAHGKVAITHYRTLALTPQAAFLAVRIETGRTHQIRVHAAEAGFPILGDPLYGRGLRRGPLGGQMAAAQLERQALHAAFLGVVHPRTGAPLSLRAPMSVDLKALALALGLPAPERG